MYRDDLAAAHARIEELEGKLKRRGRRVHRRRHRGGSDFVAGIVSAAGVLAVAATVAVCAFAALHY
jgi:hypothetical protein